MESWHSYPKVWSLGHAALRELFTDEVFVEEKIDGSQFSFGKFNGELKMRSKGQEMIPGKEKMFHLAEESVMKRFDQLQEGWTYRAEYLQKPKHNVLAYARTPVDHLIIFDINTGMESYLDPSKKMEEAKRLDLECVPILAIGEFSEPGKLTELLEVTSCLGGQKIEGFVVKNYLKFGPDGKALMGKYVSENFKEKHKVDWKEGNPTQNDIVLKLVNAYRTPARWDKAIIHLKERGLIENSPRDIGLLIEEVGRDILGECGNEIKDALMKWAWPHFNRGLVRGLPEYYKTKLLEKQFENSRG